MTLVRGPGRRHGHVCLDEDLGLPPPDAAGPRRAYLTGHRRTHVVRMTPLGYERSYCGLGGLDGEEWLAADGRFPPCKRCQRWGPPTG